MKIMKFSILTLGIAIMLFSFFTPVFGATDPLQALNNLTTFLYSGLKAIGTIASIFGLLQIGLSMQNHDPSQRATGFLILFGGLIIAYIQEILNLIMG